MAKYKIKVQRDLGFTTGSYTFATFETDDFDYIDAFQISFNPIKPDGDHIASWPKNIIFPVERCSIYRME